MRGIRATTYRASKIAQWLHQKDATSFLEMTISARRLEIESSSIQFSSAAWRKAAIDLKRQDNKILFRLRDGQCIESVLMRYEYGYSLCISSQVGCRMGCRFYASTLEVWFETLRRGEDGPTGIRGVRRRRSRISHVVVMGCGEHLTATDALSAIFP
ncbi:MAG: hypothetical protein ACLR23_04875 [Clostridia bacterium]